MIRYDERNEGNEKKWREKYIGREGRAGLRGGGRGGKRGEEGDTSSSSRGVHEAVYPLSAGAPGEGHRAQQKPAWGRCKRVFRLKRKTVATFVGLRTDIL